MALVLRRGSWWAKYAAAAVVAEGWEPEGRGGVVAPPSDLCKECGVKREISMWGEGKRREKWPGLTDRGGLPNTCILNQHTSWQALSSTSERFNKQEPYCVPASMPNHTLAHQQRTC